MSPFPVQLGNAATALDAFLTGVLDREEGRGTPPALVAAKRYALLARGKRFRPFLVIQSAGLFGLAQDEAMPAAAALECIHCYSLVHDDLPSMDNDELRRGHPTVWKAFGEWTAILVGDALQSLAFEIASGQACHSDPGIRAELIHVLAVASGSCGMVGGQVLDLEAGSLTLAEAATVAHITRLQAMKTGRLIAAACEMGAILGGATPIQRAALKAYGEHLGFAFQISDDLLDAEGNSETVGKATGKDVAAGKATLVSLLGVDQARDHLERAVIAAIAALQIFDDSAETLAAAAQFMAQRGS